MAKIDESEGSSQLKNELNEGLKVISGNQEITFTKYLRQVLPLDGYVFWVRDLSAAPISVQGSLHYDTDQQQRADETIGVNRVLFTTQTAVEQFNTIADATAWIGAIDDIRFSFTRMGKKYKNADTYHYSGDAIYPAMLTQIIDNPGAPVDLGSLIATNSMPVWLGLNQYVQPFPAFLAGTNLRPPYAAVEITETKALQMAPLIENNSSHYQLMSEKVKITIVGLRNDAAMDFLDYVLNYSLASEVIGIQNMPAIIDEKRGQSELGILAQKKTIEFEVNYYQKRVQAVARQLILNANITVTASDGP